MADRDPVWVPKNHVSVREGVITTFRIHTCMSMTKMRVANCASGSSRVSRVSRVVSPGQSHISRGMIVLMWRSQVRMNRSWTRLDAHALKGMPRHTVCPLKVERLFWREVVEDDLLYRSLSAPTSQCYGGRYAVMTVYTPSQAQE